MLMAGWSLLEFQSHSNSGVNDSNEYLEEAMAEAYRLYAGTQSGMIIFRGVGDIWTSMGGSREFEPYFREKVVDSVYGCKHNPEIVFAGVTFDGLYRTRDSGRHWDRVLQGDIRWVTVDPT